jgi:glyoxylase I family protein
MAIRVQGMSPLLQVFDMPTSIHFYCNLLGFELVTSDGKPAPHFDWCWIRLNDADLMLNTAYEADRRPAAPVAARIAAHKDTALFFSCPDVDAAYLELKARGVHVEEPRVAPYGMKQMYLRDPDGFELCFQWRADR